MQPITSITNSAEKMTTKPSQQILGKDDFLKIMIAQLRNQDPLQPLEDKEFIAQMAQFTSVEQLQNISRQLDQLPMTTSSLIGKAIEWTENEVLHQGIAEALTYRDKTPHVMVNGKAIPFEKIQTVKQPS